MNLPRVVIDTNPVLSALVFFSWPVNATPPSLAIRTDPGITWIVQYYPIDWSGIELYKFAKKYALTYDRILSSF